MASIIRLEKPCPCGSGKKYRDCCAPQNYRRKRRRKNETGDKSSGVRPNKQRQRIFQSFDRFVERFADAINTKNEYLIETYGEATLRQAFQRLEVVPQAQSIDAGHSLLVQSWDLFRLYRIDADYDEIVTYVVSNAGQPAADVFEEMKEARFGAWKIGDSGHISAIDGQDNNNGIEPLLITDPTWDEITESGTVAGWNIELDVGPVLFFGSEMSAEAVEKLKRAARRSAWGVGDEFRRDDYEEDILALVLEPHCVLAEEDCGRIILSPDFPDFCANYLDEYPAKVAASLYYFGFDADLSFVRMRQAWETQGFLSSAPIFAPSNVWAREAASTAELKQDQLHRLCNQHRDQALALFRFPVGVVGPKTTRHILGDDQILAMLHLTPIGEVDHPKAHQWMQYRLGVLDLEPSLLRNAGLDPEWTIEQGLGWAERNVDSVTLRHLRKAATRHRLAMRFVGLVNLNEEHLDPPLGDISYSDLLEGIDQFFPPWAAATPIDDLDDTGRGTWTRITRVFRDIDDHTDEHPVRLQDLPDQLHLVSDYPGIGETTVLRLWEGVFRYVKGWPEVGGHHPVDAAQSTHSEASEVLASGLDELDELF